MNEDWLWELESKRFLFVTGKGGTGKTTIATALAMALSARGKKILLVEMSKSKAPIFLRLQNYLHISKLTHKEQEVNNPIQHNSTFSVMRIHPEDSLAEYMQIKLKSKRIANFIFRNAVVRIFLETVPGLSDLVSLGKAWHMDYELTIFDAPSSGHTLELLNIPKNFASLTKMGPIFSDAKTLQNFFQSSASTAILFCALPEHLPKEETLDFELKLGKNFPKPIILVNQCYPLSFHSSGTEKDSKIAIPDLFKNSWNYSLARNHREFDSMKKYKETFPKAIFLPFFFPPESPQTIASEMAQYMSSKRTYDIPKK